MRLLTSVGFTLLVMVGGTIGYILIEGWDWLDALYMTVITVTTVGYGETHPLSTGGRAFTVILIFFGVGTVLYILGMVTQALVEGQLREVMGRRTLQRRIKSLKGHFIVCGYGRIGSLVTEILRDSGRDMVVVDNNPDVIRRLDEEEIFYVKGSATEDDTLLEAGLERAKGLIATVSSDADNVYISLTAKGLRPDLYVVARATEPGSERKLKRAGADKVVSPYFIGARRMAQIVIRPSVADFVELTFHGHHEEGLLMEELKVGPKTHLAGVPLKDSGIRQKLDLIIMAVRKPDGKMLFNPPADTVIQVGDILIALGPRNSMDKLGDILASDSQDILG